MNLMKALNEIKMLALVVLVLSLVKTFIGFIPFLGGVALCLAGPLLLVVYVVLYAYMGYTLASKGMELIDGAIAPGVVAAIVGIITGVISLIVNMLGLGANVATGGDVGGAMLGGAIGIAALVIGIVGFIIAAAVCGAIGHFLYGILKKKK